jgi:hypothetical protein
MRNYNKLLIAPALSMLASAFVSSASPSSAFVSSAFASSAFAQAEVTADEVAVDNVLVCATPADAKSYAASHKDAIQSSIAGQADEKACLVTKAVFISGQQSDRIEHSDATYAVTEILIVAVKTPYGVLRMRPNVAYTLMKLNEVRV